MNTIKEYVTSGRFWLSVIATLGILATAFLGQMEWKLAVEIVSAIWGISIAGFSIRKPGV